MNQKGEPCIRDKDGRIIAWCVGMDDEGIDDFIRRHIAEGAHRSIAEFDRDGFVKAVKKA